MKNILHEHYNKKTQIIEFDENGKILNSNQRFAKLEMGSNIESIHPFMSSVKTLVNDSSSEFPIHIASVNNIFPEVIYADASIYRKENRYFLLLENQTKQYLLVREIQQERNTQSIEANLKEQQRKSLQLEAELLRLRNEELLSIQNFKSRFFASVSHELRTPIGGILGITDLLEKTDSKKDRTQYLQTLKSSAKHLLAIVNDILDINKMESGKFNLNNEPVRLREILDDVALSFYYQAKDKGLEMNTQFHKKLPEMVEVDATRLRQILFNLLSNAVKFTHEGEVVLKAKVKAESEQYLNLLFEVKDSGIGVSQEQYEKIFEEYHQAESSTSKTYGGTGLGLSVVKKLVQLYEGHINLKSKIGKGSTFYFNLWLKKVAVAADDEKHKGSQLHRKEFKVLIVEDDPVSLMILKGIFKKTKAQTSTCLNAKKALEEIGNKDFDLLITDRQMPEISGDELARALKKSNPTSKVIMLSGESISSNHALMKNGQVDIALLKPINPEKLYNSVNDLF